MKSVVGGRWSVGLAVAVFLLAAAVLFQRASQVDYNTDEGQKIAAAGYFELVFVDRVFTGPAWDETYWTLTQPPMVRYILGAAIWLTGNPIPRLNPEHRIDEVRGPDRERYWDARTFRDEDRLNRERRIDKPSAAVLAAGRAPMVLFGAGAVLVLFLLGRALGGLVAGLVASLGLLLAPIALTWLPRANAEAPLLFFLLLGLCLGAWAALMARGELVGLASRVVRPGGKNVARTDVLGRAWPILGVLAGAATGLGAATKLPGTLGLVALAGFTVWSLAVRRWTPRSAAGSWRWSGLAAVVGLAGFVLVNPFLWPDPVGRTSAMLHFRRQELFGQRVLNDRDAVPDDLAARASVLLERSFVLEAPVARRTGLPLDAALAVVGVGVLGRRAWTGRREGGLVGPEAFVLAWIATFLVGTAPNLGLDWQRYYLPTVALGLVLTGVGAQFVVDLAVRRWRAGFRGPPDPAPAPAGGH